MTQRYQAKQAALDLSGRAKFRISGTDRLRFLNGQITNDLRKASETAALEACVLNAKGKHVGVVLSGGNVDLAWAAHRLLKTEKK